MIILIVTVFIFYLIVLLTSKSLQNFDQKLIFKRIYKNLVVVNIYYDERFKSLRLIVANRKRYIPKLSCFIKNNHKTENCVTKYVPYHLNNKDHGHILIPVSLNNYPELLVINNVSMKVPKPLNKKKKYELCVCISRTVNYVAVNRVIQTVESFRYYGVEHFTVYMTSASKEVKKVLNYYTKIGILEVITWNVKYELSIAAMDYGYIYKANDCLYRNMYKSKSLILTDWDEIIMPIKENKILDIVHNKYKDMYNWYRFRSFMFHTELYGKDDYNNNNVPDADIYSYRQYCICKKNIVPKNLYTNLSVLYEIEIHFVGDGDKNILQRQDVDIKEGFIRHTRRIQKFSILKIYCESKWIIYPKDSREEKILENVKFIQRKLNILPPPKIIPSIYSWN